MQGALKNYFEQKKTRHNGHPPWTHHQDEPHQTSRRYGERDGEADDQGGQGGSRAVGAEVERNIDLYGFFPLSDSISFTCGDSRQVK